MFKWLLERRKRRAQFHCDMTERMAIAGFAPLVTIDDVLRIIRRDFPKSNPNQLLDELNVYGPAEHHVEQQRVHAAVLKLSHCDTRLIGQMIRRADKDFREVLMLAEMPGFAAIMFPVDRFAKRPIDEVESIARNDKDQYLEWFDRIDNS